jgi:hypothetical protein
MTKTIYGLTYCEDDGSRESWNWFYMPKEVFDDEKVREQRKAILLAANPRLEFAEWTRTIITDAAENVPEFDNDDDDNDDDDSDD